MEAKVRIIVIPPLGVRAYEREEWRGALVVVARGAIELESRHGVRRRFKRSACLVLEDRRLRRLVNPGPLPARLLAITRGDAAQPSPARTSRSRTGVGKPQLQPAHQNSS